jgi:hypothetical protein
MPTIQTTYYCIECSEPIQYTGVGAPPRFCSDACRAKNRTAGGNIIFCNRCHQPFQRPHAMRYICDDCLKPLAQRQRRNTLNRQLRNTCANCQADLTSMNAGRGRAHRYCSMACQAAHNPQPPTCANPGCTNITNYPTLPNALVGPHLECDDCRLAWRLAKGSAQYRSRHKRQIRTEDNLWQLRIHNEGKVDFNTVKAITEPMLFPYEKITLDNLTDRSRQHVVFLREAITLMRRWSACPPEGWDFLMLWWNMQYKLNYCLPFVMDAMPTDKRLPWWVQLYEDFKAAEGKHYVCVRSRNQANGWTSANQPRLVTMVNQLDTKITREVQRRLANRKQN